MRHTVMLGFSLSALFFASSAFAATLYVGLNETYKTIQAGADAAKPGDTVIVRDGVYTHSTPVRSYGPIAVNLTHGGTDEAHRLTIKAEHKWGAVIDLRNQPGAGFGLGRDVSFVTIQDFEIRNCGDVDGKQSEHNPWGVAITHWYSSEGGSGHHNTIRGNHIHHCNLGIDSDGQGDYAGYCNIDGNVFHHVGGNYLKHGIYWCGDNVRITNNIFYDIVGGDAVDLSAYHNLDEAVISNNTFGPGIGNSPIIFYTNGPNQFFRNCVIQNNVIYKPKRGYAIQWAIPTEVIEGLVVRNNLVCEGEIAKADEEFYGRRFVLAEAKATLSNNISGDPLFVNPTGATPDFHLRSGSPAIGAGIAAVAPDHDADGKPRRAGGRDLGAFEARDEAVLPEGHGISARYPGDRGIGTDPTVVFAEDFEVKDLEELRAHWSDIRTFSEVKPALFLDNLVPDGSPGGKSLRITATRDENEGGECYKGLPSGNDRLFFRFYVKFAEDYGFCHHFAGLGGEIVVPPNLSGNAGVRPVNSWCSFIDAKRDDRPDASGSNRCLTPGIWSFYSYWPEMRSWENEDGTPRMTASESAKQIAAGQSGSYYGNLFGPEPPAAVERGKWTCVEIMVKMNSAPEKSDGEQALWIDGKLLARFAPGSMTGRWSHADFIRDEKGKPFEGFRWRPDPRVSVNKVWLMHYVSNRTFARDDETFANEHSGVRINTRQATVWFDHVVVSREYVGPLQ